MTTKESLVEVSPSTVTRLNEPSARLRARVFMSAGATQASVAMKPSMVAMLGRIMPAPLEMPEIVTVAPPTCTCTLQALGTVSVVMMPSAAVAQLFSVALPMAAGSAARMRSCGSGSMMTPVEKGRTCSGETLNALAMPMQVARARTRPSWPVPALALPVLITMARMPCPAAKCSRHTCTGAAQKRFWVNTPPTAVPSSNSTTVRSLRPALRMPASVTPMRTPGTGCRSAGLGGKRWTAMIS